MISGHGPSPDAGSVTLTSSGTPSKVGTRVATEPSQNRVPSRGTQVSFPNGLAGAAAAGPAAAPTTATAKRVPRRASTPAVWLVRRVEPAAGAAVVRPGSEP